MPSVIGKLCLLAFPAMSFRWRPSQPTRSQRLLFYAGILRIIRSGVCDFIEKSLVVEPVSEGSKTDRKVGNNVGPFVGRRKQLVLIVVEKYQLARRGDT